ncbi:MAG: PTS mannitol transporter subunit IICB, partial [Clostridiales bacterium]|nr:PTS mannitol transporter subunit IICB [Clostridiales bacterium]
IVGPVCAWIIKKFDHLLEGKIPAGFEMLVNNFSLGIIGAVLTVIALKGVAPVVEVMNQAMKSGVGFFVDRKLLPLASVFIEPAKVLFLNNAINHGIFSPMGILQVEEVGKSVFFLLEANPGPGLGILLAYCIAGKGSAKSSAPGAVIIHFLGGIHEIYFPYILMNPLLILAVMAGGAGGVFMFQLLGAGLTSAASPGSILAILAMTPRGEYFPVLAGVAVAAALSFVIALTLLKFAGKDEDLEDSRKKMSAMKKASKGVKETSACDTSGTDASRAATSGAAASGPIRKIVFACDAGMGSSAMGATVLKKKLTVAGFGDIEVKHSPVSSIPQDAQIVVTHQELGERAAHSNPGAKLVLITNFLAAPEYDQLVEELKKR